MKKIIDKVRNCLKDKTKRKQVMGLMLACFLLLGLSLAYMGPLVSDIVKTNLLGTGTQINQLTFSGGTDLVLTPGSDNLNTDDGNYTEETTVSATIIANDETKEATMQYSMYIDITENDYVYTTDDSTPELILTIIDPYGNEITKVGGLTYYTNTNGLSGFDVTTFGGLIRIVEDYSIYGAQTSTDNWTVKISMANLETDQGLNAMKTFAGTIDLSEDAYPYDLNLTTVSNKIDSDFEIATASITTVSCDSGDYEWNYSKNALYIYSTSEENYCTLTKEDNTSTEYNENISEYIKSLEGVYTDYSIVHETFDGLDRDEYSLMSESDFSLIENNEVTYPYNYDSSTNTWTSTNTNVAMSSTGAFITFTIKESGYLKIVASISGTKTSASSDLIAYQGSTLLFEIDSAESTEFEVWVDAGDEIEIEMEQYSASYNGAASLQFYYTNGESVVDAGYRYEGTGPNNYVSFNGELWQIVGVMETTLSNGTSTEWLTKLIATDTIGGWARNSGKNEWTNSSLYKILNTDYYGATDGSSSSSYCYKYSTSITGDCDFTETGIQSSYRDMIENVTWYLGGIESASTADAFFTAERGTTVYSGRTTSVAGYIGLMYMSDYGYSVLSSSCTRTTSVGSYNTDACAGNSWMYYGNYIWTIVPNSSDVSSAWYVSYAGFAGDNYSGAAYGVAPVLYLKSEVEIIAGTGTESDPYILSM